ncbi:MAG TPA: Pr6Pr family membrane protein [Candidatus Nanopelagicales bacterium]|nr:Pr6Pr family membrane protein [Candidatus Nanopelagicales bacterium]
MAAPNPPPARVAGRARGWFACNAAVAWIGVLLQLVLSIGGFYPSTQSVPSAVGYANLDGAAGAFGRVADNLSYFTIWSNIVVAVVLTVLALRPGADSPLLRVLRLDTLLMITITGLVYAVVLAPGAEPLQGWQVAGNFFVHQATPVVTVVVWLVVGPRGWIRWSTIPSALILPIVWLVYTLIRGAVIDAYPYGFLDVIRHGYGTVLLNVVGVLVLGLLVCAVLLAVDRWLTRGRRDRDARQG